MDLKLLSFTARSTSRGDVESAPTNSYQWSYPVLPVYVEICSPSVCPCWAPAPKACGFLIPCTTIPQTGIDGTDTEKKTRQCIKKLMAKKVCCDKVKQRGYRMTQSMIQNLQCLETGRNPGQPSWKNLFDSCYTAKRFKSFAYRPQAIPSHFSIWSGFESEPFWSSLKSVLKLIPNSESLGFQSLGPGTGDTKMHAPKNRNSPGTLLEPFTVGLQSWANIFVFVMSLGGLLERTIGIEASLFSHSWIMKLVAWNPNS